MNHKLYNFFNNLYINTVNYRFKKSRVTVILSNLPYSEPVLILFVIHTIIWIITSVIFDNLPLNIVFILSVLGMLIFYFAKNKKYPQIKTQIFLILSITLIPFIYFIFSVSKISAYPADLEMHSVAIESFNFFGNANLSNKYLFPDGQVANWYKTGSQFYPDAVHVFLSNISQLFLFKTEHLIIYFELYGTFVIWPYLVFKILERRTPRNHIITFSILFCSLGIFPISTIAWGGVNFLYGQIVCLFFLFLNGHLISFKYMRSVIFSVILFFIHPSASATFLLIFILNELSNLTYKRYSIFKKIWLPSLGIAFAILTILYFLFIQLVNTQYAPIFSSYNLISFDILTPILRFFIDFFIIGSINASNFGYNTGWSYVFPVALFLFYFLFKKATKSFRIKLIIICSLLVITKLVGVNVSILHDISRVLTFPWNSHPNRFFSVVIIFMVLNLYRSNISNSKFLTTTLFKFLVVLNFLYISVISLNAYFV